MAPLRAGRREPAGRVVVEWERAESVSAWSVPIRASLAVQAPSAPEEVLAALSSLPPSPEPDMDRQLAVLDGGESGSERGDETTRVSPASYQNHWSERMECSPVAGASISAGWTAAEVASVLSFFAQCDSTAARRTDDMEQEPPDDSHSFNSEGDAASPHETKLTPGAPADLNGIGDLAEARAGASAAARAGSRGAGEVRCLSEERRHSGGEEAASGDDASCVCSLSGLSDLSAMSASRTMTPSQSTASLIVPAAAPLSDALDTFAGVGVAGGCKAPNGACSQTSLAQAKAPDGTSCGGAGLVRGPADWIPSHARPSTKAPLVPSRRAAEAYQARLEAGVLKAEAARAASDRARRLMSLMAGAPFVDSVADAEEDPALVAGVKDVESRKAADAASAAMRAELARSSGPRRGRVAAPGGMGRGSTAVVAGLRPRAPGSGAPVRIFAARQGTGRPDNRTPVVTAPTDPRCVDVIRRKLSYPRLLG